MKINITDPLDEENIRKFAKFKKLPLTKAVALAVKIAEDVHFMEGKVASLEFFIKCLREEYKKRTRLSGKIAGLCFWGEAGRL